LIVFLDVAIISAMDAHTEYVGYKPNRETIRARLLWMVGAPVWPLLVIWYIHRMWVWSHEEEGEI